MFKASARLDRKEFAEYFAVGKRFNSPHFNLIYTPYDKTKVSVVAGKKVAKGAVDRNRLRRRAYAVLFRTCPSLPTGIYIVIYKSGALQVDRKELAEELGTLLARTANPR
jgi:ribonuclease P protein component